LLQQHWTSSRHVVKHWAVAGLHSKGSQSVVVPAWHIPLPSHCRSLTRTRPMQLAATHTVPAGWLRQPPAPSQWPSVPQEAGPSVGQRESAVPSAVAVHSPAEPVILQLRHRPQLAASQHTPSVQNPLAHSALAMAPEQVAPSGLRWQIPA
jgi:hypothetical protein